MLATRHRASLLITAFLEDWEILEHHVDIIGDVLAVFAGIRAHHQVFVDGEERENLTPFGNMSDACADDMVGVLALNFLTFQYDLALFRVHDARDGLHQRRLASAVCAQNGNNLAFRHLDGNAANGHDRTVEGLDVLHGQNGCWRVHAASFSTPR